MFASFFLSFFFVPSRKDERHVGETKANAATTIAANDSSAGSGHAQCHPILILLLKKTKNKKKTQRVNTLNLLLLFLLFDANNVCQIDREIPIEELIVAYLASHDALVC